MKGSCQPRVWYPHFIFVGEWAFGERSQKPKDFPCFIVAQQNIKCFTDYQKLDILISFLSLSEYMIENDFMVLKRVKSCLILQVFAMIE
jgi:hypothetical protein